MRIFLKIFAGVFGVGLLAVLCIWIWPNVILTEAMLEKIGYTYQIDNAFLTWKKLNLRIESVSFFRKRVTVGVENLCVTWDLGVAAGCFQKSEVQAIVDFSGFDVKLETIESAHFASKRITLYEGVHPWDFEIELKSTKPGEIVLAVLAESEELFGYLDLSAMIHKGKFTGTVDAEIENLSSIFPRITLLPCQITGEIKDVNIQVSRLEKCAVTADLQFPEAIGKNRKKVTAQLDAAFDPQKNLQMIVELKPVDFKSFHLSGKTHIQLKGFSSEWLQSFETGSSFQFDVHIPDFAGFSKFMEATPWAIPAPFHVLTGTANASVKGEYTHALGGLDLPFQMKTMLRSRNQVFEISGDGVFHYRSAENIPRYVLDLNINLENAELVLPDFNPIVSGPNLLAAVIQDYRIIRDEKIVEDDPESLKLNLAIKTGSALRLKTAFAQPWVPAKLDIHVTEADGFYGLINLDAFRIKLSTKIAELESLSLFTPQGSKDTDIHGIIHVAQTDYDITLEATGRLEEPQFQLWSYPPLSNQNIISVLIFDRTLDDLDIGEESSVGDMQAAVADRAIGLFSMMMFASTPIRRISYNPSTEIYSAKIELAKNLTFEVGTDFEEVSNLEFRKRIHKSLNLVTQYKPTGRLEENEDKGVGSLFLQWDHRY